MTPQILNALFIYMYMYANICMYMYIMCMFISFIIEVEFHYEIYYIIHLLLTIWGLFVSGHIE